MQGTEQAVVEFEEAVRTGDTLRKRQAAEKAWLAIVEAADDFLRVHGLEPPRNVTAHAVRRQLLRQAGRGDFMDQYSLFSVQLHVDCFHSGFCPPDEEFRVLLRQAKQLVGELSKS